MEKSTILIGLTLVTLLSALVIAAYQLWSADKSQDQGEHSALAARFGGKKRMLPKDPDSVFTSNEPEPKRAGETVA